MTTTYRINNEFVRCSDKYTRFCQWKNLELNIQLTMNDFSVHRIIGRGGFGEVSAIAKLIPKYMLLGYKVSYASLNASPKPNIISILGLHRERVYYIHIHLDERKAATYVGVIKPSCSPTGIVMDFNACILILQLVQRDHSNVTFLLVLNKW